VIRSRFRIHNVEEFTVQDVKRQLDLPVSDN
jgi:hypothetical protein